MQQPILVLWDSQTPNRLAGYLREVLEVEGYNWFAVQDLASNPLTASQLEHQTLVIVTHIELSDEVESVLVAYVRAGGQLVALRPPESLATAFGLVPFHRDIVNRYWSLNSLCALNHSVELPSLQFHGRATLYTWPGDPTHVMAWFEGDLGSTTKHPAIAIGTLGFGQWAVFRTTSQRARCCFTRAGETRPAPDQKRMPTATGCTSPPTCLSASWTLN